MMMFALGVFLGAIGGLFCAALLAANHEKR